MPSNNVRDYYKSQLNKVNTEEKYVERTNKKLVLTIMLLALCVIVVGILYIFKNSPDHNLIVFRDRKAPVVSVHDAVSANGQLFEIEDFVDSVEDISNVNMYYLTEPDYDTDGVQDIVIRFEDEAGNYSDAHLNLEVYHDLSAPVIDGATDVYTYYGEPISYKSFVEVYDDMDEECELEIDNSEVNINSIGDYDVVYKATDSAGNTSTKVITFHIMEPDTDEYYLMKANELCDAIISQIITPDMDDLHKVWAVYEYVRAIPYVLTDYTRNYIREGYKMLKEHQGDCYGSYSSVRLLLDRLGITNIPIQTDETWGNKHFWNMVSLDGGITWYHVDATNWVEWGRLPVMCMICDSRLAEISEVHRGTHLYIREDYPATPQWSMDIPQDIIDYYGVSDVIY